MTMPQKKSNALLNSIRDLLWAQWNRMGLNGTGGINRYSVDIEASLVGAGYGARLDGRLYEGVWGWLQRYGSVVNAERLATLIHEQNDEWVTRFLGALLENTNSVQWKGVIKRCQNLCSQSWKDTPLLMNVPKEKWRDQDPTMAKWGILCSRLSPSQKMKDHAMILNTNILMKYRYLCGTVIRSDVLYLLGVSHHCQAKREIDFLTSVRLADRLRCNPATIHRIQKNFEAGGFIQPIEEVKKRGLMTTWLVQDIPLLQRDQDYDLGIVDWVKINSMLRALLKLISELKTDQNEAISKTRLQKFQSDFFPLLLDHHIPVPTPYGNAFTSLEEYSVNYLTDMIVQALMKFYRILCCIT